MRICICGTKIPFLQGGAEALCETLHRELVERGFECDLVTVPFSWTPRIQILKSALAWRLLSLESAASKEADLVIATRFPSYVIRHPNKVVWLIHQFRQVYELLGTPYSDFGSDPADEKLVKRIHEMDRRALGEARAVFTISGNVATRLRQYNGIEGRVLYPPSKLEGRLRQGEFGDYILAAGRLEELKRVHLLVESLRYTEERVRCKIAGDGPEREALQERIRRYGLEDRIDLLGQIEDEELIELYANCLAVFYAPYDEDYGYVTLEALKSGKPVLTAADSGAVLELVEHERSGLVLRPDDSRAFARSMDRLFRDRRQAATLGEEGQRRVKDLAWDGVVEALTGTAADGTGTTADGASTAKGGGRT